MTSQQDDSTTVALVIDETISDGADKYTVPLSSRKKPKPKSVGTVDVEEKEVNDGSNEVARPLLRGGSRSPRAWELWREK